MSRTAGMVAGRQLGVISRKDSAKKPRKLLQWSLCLYLFIHLIKHVKLDFRLLSYLLTKNCFDLISITLVFNKKKLNIYLTNYSVKMITLYIIYTFLMSVCVLVYKSRYLRGVKDQQYFNTLRRSAGCIRIIELLEVEDSSKVVLQMRLNCQRQRRYQKLCYRSTLWSLSEVSHTMVRTGGVKHSGITLTLIHNYIVKCLRTKSIHSSCTYKMFSIFIFLVNSNVLISKFYFSISKSFSLTIAIFEMNYILNLYQLSQHLEKKPCSIICYIKAFHPQLTWNKFDK